MEPENDYKVAIDEACELLQSATTPEAIKELVKAFDKLSDYLTHGPFLEVFEAILTNIAFSTLFSLLAAPDNRLIVSVANLTQKLLEPVTWDMIHEKFGHPHPKVKLMVLSQILRCDLSTDQFDVDYSPAIWECLIGKDEDQHINMALNLGSFENCVDFIYTQESISVIKKIMAIDYSHKFRVYDVIATSISNSDAVASVLIESNVLLSLVLDFSSSDPLAVSNCLNLLPKMTSSRTFCEYIASQNVFDVISGLMKTGEIDGVSYDFAKSFSISAVQALGDIASDREVLKSLYQQKHLLNEYISLMDSAIEDLKLQCLSTFVAILEKPIPINSEIADINHTLFSKLNNGDFLQTLLKNCSGVFDEEIFFSLKIIKYMIDYPWGYKELAQSQNFLNFLIEKSNLNSSLKELKFSIISFFVKHQDFEKMVPDPQASKLKTIASNDSHDVLETIPAVQAMNL
ncbi:hypothetical protein BB560_001328 [Smittium megazygosporum]|uniref:26S proteasome non-ATPase regulatory subunit 5 n=1 Tax=Smittium megazygosporum TaxID=133381 RepID=A0A2T9ZHZ0_9FUNG|nr:hypothetical protein BB560_001328 [Smittium megazygosporum]